MLTKKIMAVIMSAAALTVTACSSSTDNAVSDSTATPGASGNSMSVAVTGQFSNLDPGLNTETNNSYVLSHLYSAMFRRDTDGSIVPMLAEDYTVSEDGLTWTFILKDGLKWSDGTALTAYDFEYTYLRNLSYGADNAYAVFNLVQYIEGADVYSEKAYAAENFDCTKEDFSYVGVRAIDDKTFELKLKMPCSYLDMLMCGGAWEPLPQSTPQHDSTWSLKAGYPTSGPYMLTDVNPNEKAIGTKNENYFEADQVTMDEITFVVMPDQASQALAFEAGEIDVALSVSTETLKSYTGTENLVTFVSPGTYDILFNTGEKGPEWAKNVNVRKALALAVNTDDVVEVLGGDEFYQKLEGYVPAGLPGISGDFREEANAARDSYSLAYDPEKAKELLAQEGYTAENPLKIVYRYPNSGTDPDLATLLQEQWASIGVDVDFSALESGVYWDQFDQGTFELMRFGLGTSHPITCLDQWTTGMQVVPTVDDAKFDQMMLDAKWEADYKKAMEICHEADSYVVDEMVYVVPLYQKKTGLLVQSNVKGYQLRGTTMYWYSCTKE